MVTYIASRVGCQPFSCRNDSRARTCSSDGVELRCNFFGEEPDGAGHQLLRGAAADVGLNDQATETQLLLQFQQPLCDHRRRAVNEAVLEELIVAGAGKAAASRSAFFRGDGAGR